jgi:LMBR1 domain-containing protein 1
MLPMAKIWFAFFIMVAILIVVVNPFAIFYYEESDHSVGKQFAGALKYCVASCFIFGLILGLLYVFIGQAEIPIVLHSQDFYRPADAAVVFTTAKGYMCPSASAKESTLKTYPYNTAQKIKCDQRNSLLVLPMSFPVYLIGLLSILGWFFFCIFAGIGIPALPLDLLMTWFNRPKPLNLAQWAQDKLELGRRATALIEIGNSIRNDAKGRKGRKEKKIYNKFKVAVFLLENDFEKLRIAFKEKGGSPIKYWSIGFAGMVCTVLSICWFLHLILYQLVKPPVSPFLNDLLRSADLTFSLFGTMLYAAFALHLMWCVMKGNMKFGLRLFFLPIHPMRIGRTMMNAFLVNVSLILMASVACVQFCASAFAVYATNTQASFIFGTQVRTMKYLKYFFYFYDYAFISIMTLSLFFLCLFPKDKPKTDIQDDINILQGRGKTTEKKLKGNRWFGK